MKSWLGDFERQHPVDLVIANAGTSAGPEPESPSEGVDSALRQIRVNLGGAINTIEPPLPEMCRRGRGAIAASRGLPNSPGYRASKAGLRAHGRGAAVAAGAARGRRHGRLSGVFRFADDRPLRGADAVSGERPPAPHAGQARHRSRPAAVGLSLALGLRFLRRGAGDRRRRDPVALPLSHWFSRNAR
jgi:hypothetical protein